MTPMHLFSPLALRGVTLPNRIVISPMQQYRAEPDGLPNAFHRQHYGRLSLGGPGLLFTEALAVTAAGRVTNSDLGIWSNDHLPGLADSGRIVREGDGSALISAEDVRARHLTLEHA